eukprot:PhF_6_TR36336/c2_g1_i6/m.53238
MGCSCSANAANDSVIRKNSSSFRSVLVNTVSTTSLTSPSTVIAPTVTPHTNAEINTPRSVPYHLHNDNDVSSSLESPRSTVMLASPMAMSTVCDPQDTCPEFHAHIPCGRMYFATDDVCPIKNESFVIKNETFHDGDVEAPTILTDNDQTTAPAMDPPPDTVTSAVTYRDNDGNKVLNHRYVMVDTIGKGSFAKVKVAHDVQTNQTVAVKIMRKSMFQHQYIQN